MGEGLRTDGIVYEIFIGQPENSADGDKVISIVVTKVAKTT